MNDSQPNTNITYTPQYYELPVAVKTILLAIEISFAIIGVLGNVLVVIVITKRANMKTTMNLYLRNLAIADLGVLCVIWPLTTMLSHTDQWLLGEFFCRYIWPVTEIFYGASIWSIAVIAFERYRNIISRRAFAKRPESKRKITLKILAIWVLSFAVVAVPMFFIMEYAVIENQSMCYPNWPIYYNGLMVKTYTIVLAVFWYVLPLVIITATYTKISFQLKQSTQFHKKMHGDDRSKSKIIKDEEKQRLKQNKKAKRVLTPLVVVFAITMLPFNVFRFVGAFSSDFYFDKYYYLYASICLLFVIINSAVDPLVYYVSSKEFRKVLKPMLRCKSGIGRDDLSCRSTKTTKTTREGYLLQPSAVSSM